MNIIVLIFFEFSHFFSWGFIYITWNTIVQIFYNYQGQDSVKISDKISDRKPNLNMDENTQFKLIIFKCILEENVDLLIQTFKTLSLSTFSTLIFPLSYPLFSRFFFPSTQVPVGISYSMFLFISTGNGTVSNTPLYSNADDWERELNRCGCTKWNVCDVNRGYCVSQRCVLCSVKAL